MIAVGVLGALVLAGPDGPVVVGSTRQRRLLSALVALPDGATTDQLADLVWGDAGHRGPADRAGAVQTNVARLRRLLPPGVRIDTTPTGYRLAAARDRVDVSAFVDGLEAAARAGDATGRLAVLEEALRLWRGRPFAELDHAGLAPEVARLEQLHSDALEQRARALLETGRIGPAIAAAEALVATEPLREGPVEVLAAALAAAGRPAEALDALRRMRRRLGAELGLDPGPGLQAVEQRVLEQDIVAPAVPEPRLPTDPVPGLPVSSFVGRADDLRRVVALLPRRVVTVCGPGGVGKTRLARHAVAEVHGRYPDGTVFVELGAGGPGDVEPAVAAALRIADSGEGSLRERIVSVLAVRRGLLVLDNCEHVADEVAELAEAVCLGVPGVDLLLTSREPLRVDGEQVLRLAPLQPADARRLLADRMAAAASGRHRPEDDDALAAELCHRLDGLPLALELAASRAASMGLRGLLDTLAEPAQLDLDVLRGGRRTAGPRHRSLRDVVEWSYGLLDEEQRRLLVQLGTFAGAVDEAAVRAVCGDAAALPDLVDRSLVECVEGTDGRPARYGMLGTLRSFSRARLATDHAAAELRSRHAAWAVGVAAEIARERRGPGEAAAVRRFDELLPDLRRAHAWLAEAGRLEDLLQLGVLMGELAWQRCRIDLVRLVERTLEVAGVGPGRPVTGPVSGSAAAARLLGLLATIDWQRGALAAAETRARHAIGTAEAAGCETAAAIAHEALANVHSFRGDLAQARAAGERAATLAVADGDEEWALIARVDLLLVAAYGGDRTGADVHEAAAVALAERLGSPSARAWCAYGRGERAAEAGDRSAADHLTAAVRAAESVDAVFVAGVARHTLLTSSVRDAGDPERALAGLHRLVDHWHRAGAWTQLWVAVRAVVETLARLDRHEEAVQLLGALRASARATRPFGADATREERVERAARAALGPRFEAALATGAALGDEGAVALARRLTRPAGGPQPRSDLPRTGGAEVARSRR